MSLNVYSRAPLDPFELVHFVICAHLYVGGLELVFGDAVPEYTELGFLHTHFDNGAIGTKAELESLDGDPVALYHDDPLMPIAMFVADPDRAEREAKEQAEIDDEKGVFHLENAGLLTTKKDLAGYANEFGFKLTVDSKVTLKKMLSNLEQQVKEAALDPV